MHALNMHMRMTLYEQFLFTTMIKRSAQKGVVKALNVLNKDVYCKQFVYLFQ